MKPQRIEPRAGQESVWDYPRPPRLEACDRHIEIVFAGQKIAETSASWRVLETSHPPIYYIPPEAIAQEFLTKTPRRSFCEWKGLANYYDLRVGDRVVNDVAWAYAMPTMPFWKIRNHLAFYAAPMDRCTVDGIEVIPQPGEFYGGWITPEIVGPFKGIPGSDFW